jgi:hypothetical protein
MIQAKMEREQKKVQMLRLEARLRKLHYDEEKTNKNISKARRQQDFVMTMQNEKQKELSAKHAYN